MVKSVVTENYSDPKPKYPYLGITEEKRMVLFSKEDTGIIVSDPTKVYEVGCFSSAWAEERCFVPATSSVTLSNE